MKQMEAPEDAKIEFTGNTCQLVKEKKVLYHRGKTDGTVKKSNSGRSHAGDLASPRLLCRSSYNQ
ncbi:MAG: hypothetical protein V8S12_01600 [Lachnospiraceae bacterium]